ncbi:hypothetical protein AALP_AA7G220900 [Arabis alpina]|uniref:Copine C-terminal domain-containing protein n=1 Tax=Arabis alpina TaxID=50452 RepID=A0A087GJS7_ARAAL|nr:hypothetical protein AALP_AA7G220900 [Arabis alpina]
MTSFFKWSFDKWSTLPLSTRFQRSKNLRVEASPIPFWSPFDDGRDGNDGEGVVDKSSYQFMSQRDLPLKKRSVEVVAPREEPTGVGHKHEDTALKSELFVDKFTETGQHTFLEYLASGFELNFMVAIDFTASNGNSRLPDSLCYIDPTGRLNAYLRAIVEVGEVLQFYDSDKRLLACGFRARVIDIPVSHCFNLNRSSTYCEVDGTQGIMNAYNGALFNVSSAGPTIFGPLINAAATVANKSLAQNARICYVLLIITDGVMTDVQETKGSLVSASDLPLSILIVGVGRAEYKETEVLDGDKGERLEHSSSLDMVQFVA